MKYLGDVVPLADALSHTADVVITSTISYFPKHRHPGCDQVDACCVLL